MATTYIWTGATDGDWTDQTNWLPNDSNYPGAAVGDTALFMGSITNSPTEHLDGTLWTVGLLAKLGIAKDYDGTIGSSGTHLKCGVTELQIDAAIAGDIYIEGIDASESLDSVYLLDGAPSSTIYLSGYMKKIYGSKGNVEFAAGCTVATSLFLFPRNSSSDLNLTIYHTPTTAVTTLPSAIYCAGAIVKNFAPLTTGTCYLHMTSGQWTQGVDGENSDNCGAMEYINLYGGTLYWNKGDINTAYLYGGKFDATKGHTERNITGSFNIYHGISDFRTGLNVIDVNLVRTYGLGYELYMDTDNQFNINS